MQNFVLNITPKSLRPYLRNGVAQKILQSNNYALIRHKKSAIAKLHENSGTSGKPGFRCQFQPVLSMTKILISLSKILSKLLSKILNLAIIFMTLFKGSRFSLKSFKIYTLVIKTVPIATLCVYNICMLHCINFNLNKPFSELMHLPT